MATTTPVRWTVRPRGASLSRTPCGPHYSKAAFTSCPRSVVVFATLAVLRPSVVQTPTANPIVVAAALARDHVTTDYRSYGQARQVRWLRHLLDRTWH